MKKKEMKMKMNVNNDVFFPFDLLRLVFLLANDHVLLT